MKRFLIILIFIIPGFIFSQDCNCESTYSWVKKTMEENDAGFSYIIDGKGRNAYEAHNAAIEKEVKTISDPTACKEVLQEWLAFFRSGHLSIKSINNGEKTNDKPINEEIIAKYKDWKKLDVNMAKFTKYLQSKINVNFEGVWEGKAFKLGIKKEGHNYIGFIIEGDGAYWTKGQIKLIIDSENRITYYLNDRTVNLFFDRVELIGNNYLQMGFMALKRVSPEFENNPKVEEYIKTIRTKNPYFERIDEQTNLLRIPTFAGNNAKIYIDSIVSANKELILSTPNLIIDIRNNGGGSDRSYKEILPFLYTNPIRTIGVKFLSTPLNNQRMLDFINDPAWGFNKEEKKWAKESYDKLSAQIGEFVNLDSTDVSITTYDTVYSHPKNVGIIINEYNGSSAEQFLLTVKQSKKVKLFGTTTMGVLDISNMYFVKSPCKKFELGYSLSRSMRIPEMTIDNIGIQPDYYIDKSIPKYEWVEFAAKTLKQ